MKDFSFTTHVVDDKHYYEIPDSLFNREMLMVSRISKTATGIGFGGGKINEQVLRWEKKDKKVLLRVVSYSNFAADSLPIHEAVVNSNFEPVLFAFDIKAKKKDSLAPATVIEVGPLFKDDVQALGMPGYYRTFYRVSRLDGKRSYIESIKSYPMNIEARHVKTYAARSAPSNQSLGSISIEINNSMILLPKDQMKDVISTKGWAGLPEDRLTMVLMSKKVKRCAILTDGDWKSKRRMSKNSKEVNSLNRKNPSSIM